MALGAEELELPLLDIVTIWPEVVRGKVPRSQTQSLTVAAGHWQLN